MAGHSKWSTIKRAKEKNDIQNAKVFAKIGRELAVAVKLGGPEPNNNPRLKNLIAKARSANMPNDNINRIIKKTSGELGSVNYDELTYEGYGVGGSAVMVNCLTDNKNRTAGEIRHAFDKFGGSLGSTNCVSYLFSKKGVILIEKTNELSDDDIMMHAINAGADDVETFEDHTQITTSAENFESVRDYLEENNVALTSASIDLIPDNYINLDDEKIETFNKFINHLNDLDDVQEVFHNIENAEE